MSLTADMLKRCDRFIDRLILPWPLVWIGAIILIGAYGTSVDCTVPCAMFMGACLYRWAILIFAKAEGKDQ